MRELKTAIVIFISLTILTGIIYPIVVTVISEVVFPWQANGSLIQNAEGKVIGSVLTGQSFTDPKYFWSRPSATADFQYNSYASGGSNLGPTNNALILQVNERIKALDNSGLTGAKPSDLVMSSASGLDPHIRLESALIQVQRVANARKMDEAKLRLFVIEHSEERQLGFLGEPRVNVLKLNIDLDKSEYSNAQ
jgi:potassium-transporting ATPase KdpC subunit